MFPGPLRAFHEVVQTKSIRRASEKLGLAPSSVSRQIAVLEAMMGTALLNRSIHGVALTHAGAIVAEYARSAVMEFDTLRLDLDDLKGNRGLIRVAVVESIVAGGPVKAIAEFRKSFSDVSFEVIVMPAPAVADAIVAKEADIGISFCTEPRAEIVHEATIVEPLMLVVRSDHALAEHDTLTIEALRNVTLALPDTHYGVRRLVEQVALAAGITITPALMANSFAALRDFAESGAGATILPMRAIESEFRGGNLRAIRLDHPLLSSTTLDLIRLKQWRMPRIVRLYLEQLKIALREPLPSELGASAAV
jgi:DNA-binding transcriptional LysR family regulator